MEDPRMSEEERRDYEQEHLFEALDMLEEQARARGEDTERSEEQPMNGTPKLLQEFLRAAELRA